MRALVLVGLSFAPSATLNLATSAKYSAEPGPTLPKPRLLQRWALEAGWLVTASQSRPGAGLVFALDAEDRSGHRGTTSVPFGTARQEAEAMDRALSGPSLAPVARR